MPKGRAKGGFTSRVVTSTPPTSSVAKKLESRIPSPVIVAPQQKNNIIRRPGPASRQPPVLTQVPQKTPVSSPKKNSPKKEQQQNHEDSSTDEDEDDDEDDDAESRVDNNDDGVGTDEESHSSNYESTIEDGEEDAHTPLTPSNKRSSPTSPPPTTTTTTKKTTPVKKSPLPKKKRDAKEDVDEGRKIVAALSQEDMTTLLSRLEKYATILDNRKVGTRTGQIKWEEVAFSKYDSNDCLLAWTYLSSQRRKHRNMWEVMTEIKELTKSNMDVFRKDLIKAAPGYPKRPGGTSGALSMFANTKYETMVKAHKKPKPFDYIKWYKAAVKEFNDLPEKEQSVWKKKSVDAMDAYKKELAEFYKNSDLPLEPTKSRRAASSRSKPSGGGSSRVAIQHYPDAPVPPQSAISKFVQSKIDSRDTPPSAEEIPELKEKYTRKYNQLSDSKKNKWVSAVIGEIEDYYAAVRDYKEDHPSYEPKFVVGKILSKAELELWEHHQGKPPKPPATMNLLFRKELEDNGDLEFCETEEERKAKIDEKWGAMSWYAKELYKVKFNTTEIEYRQAIVQYLGALPEFLRTSLFATLDKKTKQHLMTVDEAGVDVIIGDKPKRKSKVSSSQDKEETKISTEDTPSKKPKKKKRHHSEQVITEEEEEEEMTGVSELNQELEATREKYEEPSPSKKKKKKSRR